MRTRPPRPAAPARSSNDPDLTWVLGAAFGPASLPADRLPPVAGSARRVDLARRLGISVRVASRVSPLPSDSPWAADRKEMLARELTFDVALAQVEEEARALGAPAVLLKHAALRRGGWVEAGARSAADLDLLVPRASARALFDRLVQRGFRVAGEEYEHQLPALRGPGGALVELHLKVPLIRIGGRSLELEQLLPASSQGSGSELRIPPADFLLAHAWAHALLQHGSVPDKVPVTRLLVDALDLGVAGPNGASLRERAAGWLENEEQVRHLETTCRLAVALAEDRWRDLRDSDPDAAELLDHALAGALDPGYSRGLDRPWRPQWSDRPWAAAVAGHWLRELTRAERWGEWVLAPMLFFWAVIRLTFWVRRAPLARLPSILRRARPVSARWARHGRLQPRLAAWVERFGPVVPPSDLGPCLKRSLLLVDLLRRCGVETRFHCGVRRVDRTSTGQAIEAHAWVTIDGRVFPESSAPPPGFAEVWVD